MNETKQIVLIDLDLTLIDREYQATESALQPLTEVIRELVQRGVQVGFNSDTPIQSLRWWSHQFGIFGPIVAENGQVIALKPSDAPEFLSANARAFDALRKRVLARLLSCGHYAFIGCGDVTLFKAKGGRPHGIDEDAFLINGLRQSSFSMYALRLDGNSMRPNDELMSIAETIVRSEIQQRDLGLGDGVRVEPNPSYGILIVHEAQASKSLGIRRLMEKLGGEYEFFMVGDSTSDVIADTPSPVRMCAVGNACMELKVEARESGGFVAEQELTAGVVEILQSILKGIVSSGAPI